MAKRRIRVSRKKEDNGNGNTQLLTGAAGGAVASGITDTSTPIISSCPPDDKTFMCKLTRFYNSFKMIIGIILIIAIICFVAWFLWSLYKSKK